MKYIINGKFVTGERYTESAANKKELERVLEKIEKNAACNPPEEVRQALYIVEEWSENRGSKWEYKTEAEALKMARTRTRAAKAWGVRSVVTVYLEGTEEIRYSRRTSGTKYARG